MYISNRTLLDHVLKRLILQEFGEIDQPLSLIYPFTNFSISLLASIFLKGNRFISTSLFIARR